MAAYRKLLPLLDFARLGGDPMDNPTPWSWPTWRQHYPNDRAPWAGPRWAAKTGFCREEWGLARGFVVAFYAAGDNHKERCAFATSLSEGPLFDGLQLLAKRLTDDWNKAGFDNIIEVILVSMDITKLDNLFMHINHGIHLKDNVANMLLGRDAFGPTGLHPSVAIWVGEVLQETMNRWIDIHDRKALETLDLQRDVYLACCDVSAQTCSAQDVVAYLTVLSSLVKQLDLTVNNERQRQLDYYRDLLGAIGDLLDGGPAASTCMPYNMREALMRLASTSPHDRADVKTSLAACWDVLDMASDHAPDFTALFDVYEKLSKDALGLQVCFDVDIACLEENPEVIEVGSLLWENEDNAGFLFAVLTLPHVHD